jgi:hypothetical protein
MTEQYKILWEGISAIHAIKRHKPAASALERVVHPEEHRVSSDLDFSSRLAYKDYNTAINASYFEQHRADKEANPVCDRSYSEYIGSRIAQAISARRWKRSKLCEMLEITEDTLGRMISGQERLNMDLCCKAMRLMDFDPQLLLSNEAIVGSWTGISAIDAMLEDLCTDRSQSGVEALGCYVTEDYLCCSHLYSKDVSSDRERLGLKGNGVKSWFDNLHGNDQKQITTVYDKAQHGHTLLGIPFNLERRLNLQHSEGTHFSKMILQATLIGENEIFICSDIKRIEIQSGAVYNEFVKTSLFRLEDTFQSVISGSDVRINRQTWFI